MPNEKLVTARKNQGFTQNEIAQKAGVSTRMYQGYEFADCEPRARIAIRIADALGVKDLRELWGDSGTQSTAIPC